MERKVMPTEDNMEPPIIIDRQRLRQRSRYVFQDCEIIRQHRTIGDNREFSDRNRISLEAPLRAAVSAEVVFDAAAGCKSMPAVRRLLLFFESIIPNEAVAVDGRKLSLMLH